MKTPFVILSAAKRELLAMKYEGRIDQKEAVKELEKALVEEFKKYGIE